MIQAKTAMILCRKNGIETFEKIELHDLKEGMVFKLFEADGTPIMGLYCDLFLALSDASLDENGVVKIDIEMLGEDKSEDEDDNDIANLNSLY